jgi:hypothetical protein
MHTDMLPAARLRRRQHELYELELKSVLIRVHPWQKKFRDFASLRETKHRVFLQGSKKLCR